MLCPWPHDGPRLGACSCPCRIQLSCCAPWRLQFEMFINQIRCCPPSWQRSHYREKCHSERKFIVLINYLQNNVRKHLNDNLKIPYLKFHQKVYIILAVYSHLDSGQQVCKPDIRKNKTKNEINIIKFKRQQRDGRQKR